MKVSVCGVASPNENGGITHLSLDRFLPCLVNLSVDPNSCTILNAGSFGASSSTGARQHRDFSRHRMQKTHFDVGDRILRFISNETLRLHRARLAPLLCDAVSLRINPAKGEAFALILFREAR